VFFDESSPVPPADEKAAVKVKSKSIPTFHKVGYISVIIGVDDNDDNDDDDDTNYNSSSSSSSSSSSNSIVLVAVVA